MRWDDLRLALAVARGHGLAGAATQLGVDPSTVFRRLGALEARLGVRLFDRRAAGWPPTPAGDRLLDAAERMEAEALELDRELTGRDQRLSGKLRVTSSETLAFRLLPPMLATLRGVQHFVVACPKDLTMYRDAVKTAGLEGRIVVKDLIELVEEATRTEIRNEQ